MEEINSKFYEYLQKLDYTVDESETDMQLIIGIEVEDMDDLGICASIYYRVWDENENDWIVDRAGIGTTIDGFWDDMEREEEIALRHAHDWQRESDGHSNLWAHGDRVE
jgi:hypothetical protein